MTYDNPNNPASYGDEPSNGQGYMDVVFHGNDSGYMDVTPFGAEEEA